MAASTREINRSLLPSAKTRATIAKRLAGVTGKMTTATIAEMEARYHWFRRLDAEHRSWITLVAQAGIDGFVRWFAAGSADAQYLEVFGSAPRELARKISSQTVELVRTTIEVVESQIDELMPKGDRPHLHVAIGQYSREGCLSATEIYARAAEVARRLGRAAGSSGRRRRAAWRDRRDRAVTGVDSGLAFDRRRCGRRRTRPTAGAGQALESIRHSAAIAGSDMLGAVQGDRMIVVLAALD